MKTFLILLLSSTLAFSTVLRDIADNLAPGTWAEMPENASMAQMDMHYSILYWADGAVWNPVNNNVQFIGGPGTCCANPARFKLITYDLASDYWKIENTPYVTGGHSNDCNALDPNTGIHYFALFNDNAIKKYDDKSWSVLPERPGSKTPSSGLDWFPDMNGGQGALVCFAPKGVILWYNNGTWMPIPGATATPYGDRHIISEYNPVHKLMWFGGGGNVMYKMDGQLNVTKLKNAPFTIGSGSTNNTTDPVSGKHIVFREDPVEWWEYDIVSDTWTKMTNTMFPVKGSMFQVPIPEYGIILFFTHYWKQRHAFVYKHGSASAINVKGVAKNTNKEIEVSVLPNPFNAITKIAVSCPALAGSAVSNYSLTIFDINGKCIKHLSLKARESFTWNPIGIPNGIYLLKATAGNHTVAKKLFLQR